MQNIGQSRNQHNFIFHYKTNDNSLLTINQNTQLSQLVVKRKNLIRNVPSYGLN